MGWEQRLDRWLTTPPEHPEPKINGACEQCGEDLYEGDEVWKCDNSGALLCSDECAKEWLLEEWQEYFTSTEVEYRDEQAEYEDYLTDRRRNDW